MNPHAEFESVIAEAKAVQNMYLRMSDMCWRKCVTSFKDSTFSPGEALCVERCVIKYMDAQLRVYEKLRTHEANVTLPSPAPL